MWIYEEFESGLFTVGHYDGKHKFVPESDHEDAAAAASRVHYLNGGTLPYRPSGAAPAQQPALEAGVPAEGQSGEEAPYDAAAVRARRARMRGS